ncbi:MAG: carbonic anhydrase family protein [Actinomycetota bacterium]|nr:carbonic anhydrase family protein [Actinomycetota bacterium]
MDELTRRQMLTVTGAAAATIAASLLGAAPTLRPGMARAQTATWSHDPASPIGPDHWADIGFPTCGQGMRQSPVNIRTRQVAADHGRPLLLSYQVSELTVENTGHVVEVPIPTGVHDTLRLDGDRYQLAQYHFHAPSEHAINGRLADMEAHLVHHNAQGATAVVGILFRRGPDPNPLLDKILLSAPATAGAEVHAGDASPAELFDDLRRVTVKRKRRVQVNSFYTYDGSLTTPGCTENVRWSVVAAGGQVSKAAVTRFHEVISRFPGYGGYPNNNRPLQPLNRRVVQLRRGRHED